MEEEVEWYDYSDILHMHCRSCYQAVCTEQENCVIARCLYCAMSLHSCKIDDHETICLMVQVACPNAAYGCSSKILKAKVAKHLETCPANVIHCGMEWNRYPLYSRERYTLTNIYNSQEGKIKQKREHWVPFSLINPPKVRGQVDTEFAISDQRKLLKEKQKKMAIGKWKVSRRPQASRIPLDRISKVGDLLGTKLHGVESSRNCGDLTEKQLDPLPIDKLHIDDLNSNRCVYTIQPVTENEDVFRSDSGEQGTVSRNENQQVLRNDIPTKLDVMLLDSIKKGKHDSDTKESVNVKIEEEVLEDQNEPEVDAGSWKEKENSSEFQEEQSYPVDSADVCREEELIYHVQVQEEDFHTEKEAVIMCNSVIGVPQVPARVHEQMKNAATEQLGLNVVIETIPKFQKNYPMYSIPCNVDLRRDQYCSHFKNIHNDIHGGLNYWIQQHCPLAQYGCPYIRHRFSPGSKGGRIVFDHEIDNFGIVPGSDLDNVVCGSRHCFDLLNLPMELLEKIALFLDSYSINQFSKACRTTHEICRNLLQRRGIVILEWERCYYPDGSVHWRVRRKRWLFTPSFSSVSAWHFTDEPAMGEHLRNCQFFHRLIRKQRVPLPIADFRNVKLNSEWR